MSCDSKEQARVGMGEGEYGNIELSYKYTIENIELFFGTNNIKMFDIGTNMGSLPYLMFLKNYDMKGVDRKGESIKKSKERYIDMADRLFRVNEILSEIEDESFDVVTMFDVIEHIPHVEEYLRNAVFRFMKHDSE